MNVTKPHLLAYLLKNIDGKLQFLSIANKQKKKLLHLSFEVLNESKRKKEKEVVMMF